MLLPLLRAATVTVLGAGAMLLPWMLRNYLQFGQPLIATSHGGYTLLLANNPEFYAFLKQANGPPVWDAETSEMAAAWRAMQEQARDDELAVDRWATAQAWQHIAEYPADFAYSTAVRVGRFWQWLPHRTSRSEPAARFFARLAVALWYGCVTGAALLGALVLRRDFLNSPLLWGLLLAGSLTLVHAIYWSNMRMRAPVMPLVCVLAAVGGAEVSRRK